MLLPFLDGVQQLSLLWGSQKRRQKSKPSVSMTLARSKLQSAFGAIYNIGGSIAIDSGRSTAARLILGGRLVPKCIATV